MEGLKVFDVIGKIDHDMSNCFSFTWKSQKTNSTKIDPSRSSSRLNNQAKDLIARGLSTSLELFHVLKIF